MQEPTSKLKNSSPKHGMKLHKFIATGGKPSKFKGVLDNAVYKGEKESAPSIPGGEKK